MKVVDIRPVEDPDTVAACKDLLRRAESGEIVSIIALCEEPSGSRLFTHSACRDTFALLADAARLVHRINRRLDDATTEAPR